MRPEVSRQLASLSPLGRAALKYIERFGWKLHPLLPGTKIPLKGTHGYRDASNDPDQIIKWWSQYPDANIGFNPGINGMVVIDLDGEAAQKITEFPETLMVATPGIEKLTGGYHLYYNGTGRTTYGELDHQIDTIGLKGHVVLPPSIVKGRKYRFVNTNTIADLPGSIAARIAPSTQSASEDISVEPDLPINVAKARSLLIAGRSKGDSFLAVAGRRGNCTTYKVAASLYDYGLSTDKVFELMQAEYNPYCSPPWSEKELRTIVESAGRNRQLPIGAKALQPSLLTGERLLAMPDPEPLVPGFLQRNEHVIVFGPPKSGKSYIMLDAALAIAAGVPVFGRLPPKVTGPTVYFSGEGHGGIKRRMLAWCEARKQSLTGIPFYYGIGVPEAARHAASAADTIARLEAELPSPPVLVVIDTMARSMVGLDENAATDTGKYLELAEAIRKAVPGLTVVTISHSGHMHKERVRGSSNTIAGADGLWRTEMSLQKDIKLVPVVMKDAEDMPTHYFRFARVKDGSYLEYITEADFADGNDIF